MIYGVDAGLLPNPPPLPLPSILLGMIDSGTTLKSYNRRLGASDYQRYHNTAKNEIGEGNKFVAAITNFVLTEF